MERTFKREIQSLGAVFDLIREFVTVNNIDDSITFSISLASEELFTNMVKYNSESTSDISVSLRKDENRVIIDFIDFDEEPFDITKVEEVNTHQRLEERKVGGLGIHLLKKMVDAINYEYSNGRSKITLVKNLEK